MPGMSFVRREFRQGWFGSRMESGPKLSNPQHASHILGCSAVGVSNHGARLCWILAVTGLGVRAAAKPTPGGRPRASRDLESPGGLSSGDRVPPPRLNWTIRPSSHSLDILPPKALSLTGRTGKIRKIRRTADIILQF